MNAISNPQIPNPDQLEFIHPKANPHTNAARYDEPATELKAGNPTVILGPNATYLVQPGYWEAKAEEIRPPEPPEPPADPVLSSLEPNTLPVWASDTEVFYKGENFTSGSKIIWNGSEEATKFIDENTLSTIVKPSTVQAPLPFTLETYVVDNGKESTKLTFTFIT